MKSVHIKNTLILTLAMFSVLKVGSVHATGQYSIPNFIGIGVGKTPDYHGSGDDFLGLAPGARVTLEDNKFVEWYGPYAALKINNHENLEFGPALIFKLGRESVDNPRVGLLDEIGHGAELGVFLGYSYINTDYLLPFRYRIGVLASTEIVGGSEGSNFNLYNSLWVPVSSKTFIGFGGGLTWADDRYMNRYFSVSSEESQRSGISEFSAYGGLRQGYGWAGLVHRVGDNWAIGAGAYAQYLKNDAKNSSIVQEQGDKNQLTYGVGVGYFF